jgi:hypothetical protein
MLILHVAAIKERDTALFLWAEAAEEERSQGKRKSSWGLLSGRKHPYGAERDLLAAALPAETVQMGFWLWLTAWLPSDTAGPLPSEEGPAPLLGRKAEQLTPWGVRVLGAAADCLHDLFLSRGRQAGTTWRFGAEGPFLERVHELAGALVARQQFLPGITQEKGHWFPDWCPVYSADDAKRMAQLAEVMPVSIRALHGYALRPPIDAPHWIIDSLIHRLVGTMVKRAELQYQVYKIALHRRRVDSVDDLWLQTLLVPGTEIHARKRDLVGLANEIGCWRAAMHRMPKLELGDDLPEISLPPNGDRFWRGGQLPKPNQCPEMPRRPVAILEQAGALPNWQGATPLSESLLPVYDAASRYALEHVFGRK